MSAHCLTDEFRCKYATQTTACVKCTHSNAVTYHDLKEPCKICGRKPGANEKGCGACTGRGNYIYPFAYNDCDCDGYEPKK